MRLANWRTLCTAILRKKFGVNDWNVTEESISVVGLADFPPWHAAGRVAAAARRILAEVPGTVDRALALRPLESGTTVPRQVNVYLEQATRAFVAGLWDGTVALARSWSERLD
jgi:hypothetical protein